MIRMVIETSDLSGTAMKLEDQKGWPVFAIQLQRALVADKGTRASCAHILIQHKLALLGGGATSETVPGSSLWFPEVLAEGRWTNVRILCEFVDADGLGEVRLDMRHRLHDLLSGVILYRTMSGQDIVYTNLTGDDIDKQARTSRMWCA
jgi:hypothetical protein